MGGARNTQKTNEKFKILVTKSERKGQLGRARRRWEEIIRMDLKSNKMGRCGVGFIWLRTGTSGGLLRTR
jgi:hypothetical protein